MPKCVDSYQYHSAEKANNWGIHGIIINTVFYKEYVKHHVN